MNRWQKHDFHQIGALSARGGHYLYPVAVGVLDEVDAHGLVDEADAAHLLVPGAGGGKILHPERQVYLPLAQVVGLGVVAQQVSSSWKSVVPSPRYTSLKEPSAASFSRTGSRPRASR